MHDQQRGYRFRGALLVVHRLVKLLQGLLVVATVAETPAEKGHEISGSTVEGGDLVVQQPDGVARAALNASRTHLPRYYRLGSAFDQVA